MEATLTAEVTAVLAAAELRQAARTPGGPPAGPGFTVDPFPFPGIHPARVIVTWHDTPGSPPAQFGWARCQAALNRAGYQTAPFGGHLAVLPARPRPRCARETRQTPDDHLSLH